MIKTLAGGIRQYKWTSLLTVVLMVGEVALEIAIPLLMGTLIDRGVDQGDMTVILRYGALLLLFALLQLLTGGGSAVAAAHAGAGFAANLRQDMFDRVQTFSFFNIDRFSTASIVTRMTTDVTNIQMAYQMGLRTAVRSPVMLIMAVVFSFRIDAKIASVFLVVAPLLLLVLVVIIRRVHPIFHRVFERYDALNGIVQENLRGVRVVKSFNREEFEEKKFAKISQEVYRDFSKAERTITLIFPVMQVSIYVCMIAISWLGAQGIVASGNNEALGLTTGQLTTLLSYQMQILMSMMMLAMIFSMLTISQASGERIAELLTEESTIQKPEEAVETVSDGSIRFEDVTFSYAQKEEKSVLKNISLNIESGQTVGILGGTGASKTTLVQMIPRLYDVAGGSVIVGGHDVRDYDIDALRGEVAMVLQKNELFSGTVAENLRWGNENATDEELEQVCRMAAAHDFIQEMPGGYDAVIEQGGANVSGGQKQRLCIARALLKKPKVLILDDSTSAVDTRTDRMIQQALASYIPETTKIIIAQRVSSVQQADKIFLLDGGRLVDEGTHESLLKSSEIYREVYESQQRGTDDLDILADQVKEQMKGGENNG